MNLLLAAISGWGKSYHAQGIMEESISDYSHFIVLDFCDEYRGLVKAGLASHAIVGEVEAGLGVSGWMDVLEQNKKVVLARVESMTVDEWRQVCADVIEAGRRLDDPLFAIDEAHFVAPQEKCPKPITGLATTGRGEGASALWITQRLSTLEETVIAQCQSRMLGGFNTDSDLNKIEDPLEYPVDAHNAGGHDVRGLPEDLHADDEGGISVRRWENGDGDTVGSEWLFSDDSGDMKRINTRGMDMQTTHYGSQGNPISLPTY
ncbi:ATP-binding protein [Halosimplex aquaticum]